MRSSLRQLRLGPCSVDLIVTVWQGDFNSINGAFRGHRRLTKIDPFVGGNEPGIVVCIIGFLVSL